MLENNPWKSKMTRLAMYMTRIALPHTRPALPYPQHASSCAMSLVIHHHGMFIAVSLTANRRGPCIIVSLAMHHHEPWHFLCISESLCHSLDSPSCAMTSWCSSPLTGLASSCAWLALSHPWLALPYAWHVSTRRFDTPRPQARQTLTTRDVWPLSLPYG